MSVPEARIPEAPMSEATVSEAPLSSVPQTAVPEAPVSQAAAPRAAAARAAAPEAAVSEALRSEAGIPGAPVPGADVSEVPRPAEQPAEPGVSPDGEASDVLAKAAARLRYDATVSRNLVHRTSVAEVFVTDSVATGEDSFLVAAQLPRGHLIGENAPLYDYTLLIEVVRQAGVLVAHQHLGVELGSAFIFRSLNLHTMDLPQLRVGPHPAHVLVRMDVHPRRNKAGRLQGFTFTGDVSLDGTVAICGDGALLIVSKRAYQTLRAKRRSADATHTLPRFTPAPPSSVGRREARNVVITAPVPVGEGRVSTQLVLDHSHPHMFDHPLDHVPGHLQMEAARQLAIASVAQLHGLAPHTLTIASISTDFTDYAELDRVTELRATVEGFRRHDHLSTLTVPVVVDVRQEGTVTTAIRLEVVQWT